MGHSNIISSHCHNYTGYDLQHVPLKYCIIQNIPTMLCGLYPSHKNALELLLSLIIPPSTHDRCTVLA